MPSVDAVMARSLRGGVLEQFKHVVARSIAADLATRDTIGDATDRILDVHTAFSSWDGCMAASFCKWPVIAIIVVGSFLVLSIVWCLIRRLCCGLACCCSCCNCLKCCGNCCGCCDPPGGRRHKYLDDPYVPPNQGYKSQAPMQAFSPPQYAEFDVSKKHGEDSLPEMPSWDSGGSKKVMLENDEVEMGSLNKSQMSNPALPPLVSPSTGPASSHTGADPRGSPTSYMLSNHSQQGPGPGPRYFGPPSSQDQSGGYNNYNQPHSLGMGSPSGYFEGANIGSHPSANSYMSNSQDQPYGPPAGTPMGQRRRSPAAGPNGYGEYDQRSLGYGLERQGTGGSGSRMDNRSPYGMDPRMRGSPGPRRTPGPHGDYQYAPSSAHGRPPEHPGMPLQHQPYAHSPPQSPITNNGGFDFTSGFSRPQAYDRSPSEPQRPPTHEAYPGYRPYQPA